MKLDYDLIIVGAGPAGCNLARLLPVGCRALILDGSFRHEKVCAGLLSPDAQDLLARYDLHLPTSVFSSPQLFRVHVVDLATHLSRDYRRSYLNLDRARLDGWFRSLLPEHVEHRRGFCKRIAEQEGGYALTVQSEDGNVQILTCRLLVGADGGDSIVRRQCFPNAPLPRYTAIQQWFRSDRLDPFYSCVYDARTSDSCSWIFFKDGAMIFGGAFPGKNCRARFEAQKAALLAQGLITEAEASALLRTEACQVAMPTRPGHILTGKPGVYLIGEAAGFISPSSLEGISYGLTSGELLAKSLSASDDPQRILAAYTRASLPLKAKVLTRGVKRLVIGTQLSRSAILKSGIASLPSPPASIGSDPACVKF